MGRGNETKETHMKIRAQIAMVLNLDKCIGCHTCSVTCKNVWTSREGMEYAWFNNVETKPGIGYPKDWENQKRWNGGWVRRKDGHVEPRMGAKWRGGGGGFLNLPQPQPPQDRRLLRAVHLRLSASAQRARVEGDAHGASAVAGDRRAYGKDP